MKAMILDLRVMNTVSVVLAGLLLSSVLQADLLGHWQFNEQEGSTTTDGAGINDGTLKGDATFVPGGVTGNAVHMSRAGSGFVDFGRIFPFTSGDFSLSIWAKSEPGDVQAQQIVVGRHAAFSQNGYFIGMNEFLDFSQTGKAWFYMSSVAGGEPISTTPVNDGEWHHLAVSYHDGGMATLYIDGVAEANQPASRIAPSSGNFRAGGYIADAKDLSQFNGYIDELLVYDHALSQQEVRSLFENPGETEQGFEINSGLNDAWYNPLTDGQGFLISVFPEFQQMFLAWFTYDIERPPEGVTAMLGEPGHRWLTAQGPYDGNTANLTIFLTEGGVFDAAQPPASIDLDGYGLMTIDFADCSQALLTYEITSLEISGQIPIERIVPDNVPLCQSLNEQVLQKQ